MNGGQLDDQNKKDDCTGLVFRGYRSAFLDSRGDFAHREGFRLLKRRSCHCQQCESILDELNEMVYSESVIWPEVEDKALYTIGISDVTHDWETGIVDGYSFEFVKIIDELKPIHLDKQKGGKK